MTAQNHRGALRTEALLASAIFIAGTTHVAGWLLTGDTAPSRARAQGVGRTPVVLEAAQQNPTRPPRPYSLRVYAPVVSDAPPAITPTAVPTPTPVIVQPSYSVITVGGQPVLVVSGPGAQVTLPQIATGSAGVAGLSSPALTNESTGVWRLNHRLRIGSGVTLRVTRDTVRWLKLRSDTALSTTTINRNRFVHLETVGGNLIENNTIENNASTGAQLLSDANLGRAHDNRVTANTIMSNTTGIHWAPTARRTSGRATSFPAQAALRDRSRSRLRATGASSRRTT